MNKKTQNLLPALLAIALLAYPPLASAYIGPGLGLGAVSVVLGIVAGLLMLVVGVVWYPIKKLFNRFKGKKDPEE